MPVELYGVTAPFYTKYLNEKKKNTFPESTEEETHNLESEFA